MSGPFQRPHHLCLVVRDAAAGAAYYQSVGIDSYTAAAAGGIVLEIRSSPAAVERNA